MPEHFRVLIFYLGFICITVSPNIADTTFVRLMDNGTNDCDKALQEFASSTSSFTLCAIMHARPIKLCEKCAKNYTGVQSAYDKILKLEDDSGAPCKKRFINVDRLEILENGFMYVYNLWQNGHCESCLEVINGTMTDVLRNETQKFLDFFLQVNKCFQQHYENGTFNKSVCDDCRHIYNDMNEFYEQLKITDGDGNVCVDIVDSVNTTRAKWSQILQCDRNEMKLEMGLVVAILVVGFVPFVFYAATKFLTSHAATRLTYQRRLIQTFSVNSPSTSR